MQLHYSCELNLIASGMVLIVTNLSSNDTKSEFEVRDMIDLCILYMSWIDKVPSLLTKRAKHVDIHYFGQG